jgi:hypothetical protein
VSVAASADDLAHHQRSVLSVDPSAHAGVGVLAVAAGEVLHEVAVSSSWHFLHFTVIVSPSQLLGPESSKSFE